MKRRLFFGTFPAFRNSSFRIYFTGHLVSLIGTWLQTVAQGYLVYEITGSAYWVGMIAAAQTFPGLLFTLFGGVIIDRFNQKTVVTITQLIQMALAFVLAALTITNIVTPVHILILGLILGTSFAIDLPARQTIVHSIVGKNDIASAVSINAGAYNAARVIGPALAGILIGIVGIGGAFVMNGISFIAYIIGLHMIRIENQKMRNSEPPIRAIREGLKYAFSHELIRPLLILVGIVSATGWSYVTVLPILAKDVYLSGAEGLGYLQAGAGAGAVVAAVVVSAFARKVHPYKFIFAGSAFAVTALITLSFTQTIMTGVLALFFMGMGLLSIFSTINATIQRNTKTGMHGRVMSIYTFMFLGITPFGSMAIGMLTQHVGIMNAFRIVAFCMICGISVMWIIMRNNFKMVQAGLEYEVVR